VRSSPSIRNATASSGRQPHKSCFPVRPERLLSRPDLTTPGVRRATEEMGGAQPPGATRSAPRRVSMARMASTGPSPKGAPWHTQCLSVDEVINASPATGKERDKRILLPNTSGNLLDTHRLPMAALIHRGGRGSIAPAEGAKNCAGSARGPHGKPSGAIRNYTASN
jgi:hypothetical protein